MLYSVYFEAGLCRKWKGKQLHTLKNWGRWDSLQIGELSISLCIDFSMELDLPHHFISEEELAEIFHEICMPLREVKKLTLMLL